MTLNERLRAINDMRRALLDELEALDPAMLTAKPRSGKWSMLEIVEHLVLSERAIFKGLPDPSRLVAGERGAGNHVRYLVVLFVLRSGIPVRVPSPAMAPRGDRSLAELRRLWEENEIWLRSCVERLGPEGAEKAVFEHPVSGPLTVEQAVRLGQVHVDGHVRQIRALQRSLA